MVTQKFFGGYIICFVLGKSLLNCIPLFLLLAWAIMSFLCIGIQSLQRIFTHIHTHSFSFQLQRNAVGRQIGNRYDKNQNKTKTKNRFRKDKHLVQCCPVQSVERQAFSLEVCFLTVSDTQTLCNVSSIPFSSSKSCFESNFQLSFPLSVICRLSKNSLWFLQVSVCK